MLVVNPEPKSIVDNIMERAFALTVADTGLDHLDLLGLLAGDAEVPGAVLENLEVDRAHLDAREGIDAVVRDVRVDAATSGGRLLAEIVDQVIGTELLDLHEHWLRRDRSEAPVRERILGRGEMDSFELAVIAENLHTTVEELIDPLRVVHLLCTGNPHDE